MMFQDIKQNVTIKAIDTKLQPTKIFYNKITRFELL